MRNLLLASALLLGGCSGAPTTTTPDPIALVVLGRVQATAVEETVQLYGTADAGAAGSAILSAPEEAIVSAIDASVGSAVGRGQMVVRLTPSPTARLDLARAASDARAAQLAYARAQRLRADGLVGNAEVEAARAAAESAGATRSSLRRGPAR
jgi:multidrug efflux pump subunit AcrA (membrane-fusion protein)